LADSYFQIKGNWSEIKESKTADKEDYCIERDRNLLYHIEIGSLERGK
jgi:hypothetical protein